MNETSTPALQIPRLDEEDRARLRLWAQATPAQRLAWLEEAMQLAANAKRGAKISKKPQTERL